MRTSASPCLSLARLAIATLLLLALPGAALAHHCKGSHAGDPACDGSGGGGDSDDTSAIPLVCSFSDATGDSFLSDGMGAYPHDVDNVGCTTGDTHKTSGTSRIRWYTFGSGTVKRAVRKLDVVIDEGTCTNADGCAAAPDGLFASAGGVVDDMEDGRFVVEAYEGTDGLAVPHIQDLTPDAFFDVQLDFALMGTGQRWVLQLRGQVPNCELDESAPVVMSDDATLYTWPDGDSDGRPDGYTLTTAPALDLSTSPPTPVYDNVDPMLNKRTATLCSNVGIDGSGCGGAGGSALCHVISQMQVQFTWHAENQ